MKFLAHKVVLKLDESSEKYHGWSNRERDDAYMRRVNGEVSR